MCDVIYEFPFVPYNFFNFSGTNLLQTAAHEFGHSLGLSHSDANAALMAPFYRGFETKPRLNEDDIKAIQVMKLKCYLFNFFAPIGALLSI